MQTSGIRQREYNGRASPQIFCSSPWILYYKPPTSDKPYFFGIRTETNKFIPKFKFNRYLKQKTYAIDHLMTKANSFIPPVTVLA